MKARAVAVLLLLALVATACGTRLPDEAFVENGQVVEQGGSSRAAASDDGEVAAGDAATSTTVAGDGATPAGDAPAGEGGGAAPEGGEGGGAPAEGEGGGAPGAPSGPNQASDVGITPDKIVLGNITAENGVLGDAFAPAARGLRAWAQHINAKGGVNGRKVELKTCDDREDRSRALECARRLVEQDKVFALVATNTRALGGAAEYLAGKGIPVIGIPITNSFARYPNFWSVYANSYPRDGKTVGYNGNIMSSSGIYRWFKREMGLSKAAVFAYDIDESKQAGEFMVKGAELEGFKVTSYTVSFAAPSFDQAVADMQRQGVEIIFDAMDDGANRKLCDAMSRRQFKPKAKVSTVVVFGDSVGNDYNDTCRNIVFIPGDSMPYSRTDVPAVKEFRDAYARYQPGVELHQWALEAWFQGNLVADGIRSMGPAPTRKGLQDFLRGLRKYTGGGIHTGLEYGTTDYSKPTAEDCFGMARWQDDKGGWVLATSAFPFCYPDAKQFTSPALEQGN